MTKNEAREILMQILYEMDASKSMDAETAERLAHERLKGVNAQRGTQLLCSIIENVDEIDSSINEKSRSWKTGRMPKVELASVVEVRNVSLYISDHVDHGDIGSAVFRTFQRANGS